MTLFDLKKIILSIKEHKKDSLLIFLIVFVLTIFTTIFYVFYLSSEQMSKSISDNVTISITVGDGLLSGVEKDTINYKLENNPKLTFNAYRKYYRKAYDIIENLSFYSDIKEYGNIISAYFTNKNISNNKFLVSNYNERLFESDNFILKDGRLFDENDLNSDNNYILVKSNTTINLDDESFKTIEVGDLITLTNDLNEEYEFEVIGLYEKDNGGSLMNSSDYYDTGLSFILPIESLLKISSPGDGLFSTYPYVNVIGVDNANKIYNYLVSSFDELQIDNDSNVSYLYSMNDSMAKKLETPIKTIKILFQSISIIMIVIMFILLCSFLITVISARTHDLGILVSLGQGKFKTIFLFLIEVFIISSIAFAVSTPLSYKVSQGVSEQMVNANLTRQRRIATILGDEEQIDIFNATKQAYDDYSLSISNNDILIIYAYTNLIIVVSSLAALISIARINPKELLKK